MLTALFIVSLAGVSGSLIAQTTPQRELGGASSRFPEPFRAIYATRSLPSGELLFTGARRDDTSAHGLVLVPRLYVASFATGTVRAVGRRGQDYVNAGPLLPGPGDTTWMTEEWPGRLFAITPAGEAAGPQEFPPHVLPEEGQGKHSLVFVRTDTAADFFDSRSMSRAADDPATTFRDSTAIRFRGSRAQPRSDTIAFVYYLTRRTPSSFLGFTALPYGLADVWAVAPNGDVIIVRAEEYRVDRVAPSGASLRGAPLAYERRAVSRADKRAYIADLRTDARKVGFPDPGPDLERAVWPEFKPPFTGAVVFASDAVWVPMTPAQDDDPIVYDVVGFDGVLRERVAAPRGVTVIHVSANHVYGVQRDGAFLHLHRWAR